MSDDVSLFVAKREDVNPKEGEAKYGDVKYADEKNKKYPIDTEEHIRAAWNYINKSGNAAKYDAADVKAIKGRIIAAWKAKIDKEGPPSAMVAEMDIFAVDEYISTVSGEPYRILPFGKLVKGGVSHLITPEFASKFKLPHFSPPIKLGSHDETTPAGGTIARLEVRTEGEKPGLYAWPDLTPQGQEAIDKGNYRYQSPEIVWEGAYENPQTGEMMEGPFIIGDALLHVPHLGQSAALYSFEPILQGVNMSDEKIEVSKSLWDQLKAAFGKSEPAPEPAKPAVVDPEQFAATVRERDEFKAKVLQAEAETAHKEAIQKMTAEIKGEKYGQLFKDEKFAAEAAEMFTAMPDPQRDWVLRKFAALSAQVKMSKLLAEFGQTGDTGAGDPKQEFAAVIANTMKENKVDYSTAFNLATVEHPELAEAYKATMYKRPTEKEGE